MTQDYHGSCYAVQNLILPVEFYKDPIAFCNALEFGGVNWLVGLINQALNKIGQTVKPYNKNNLKVDKTDFGDDIEGFVITYPKPRQCPDSYYDYIVHTNDWMHVGIYTNEYDDSIERHDEMHLPPDLRKLFVQTMAEYDKMGIAHGILLERWPVCKHAYLGNCHIDEDKVRPRMLEEFKRKIEWERTHPNG